MYKQLTSEQRYAIKVLLQTGISKNAIAKSIGVSCSTVTRELSRNGSRNGCYKSDRAQQMAMKRRKRSVGNRSIGDIVKKEACRYIKNSEWSPRQISGWLALEGIHISHETIYKMIREDMQNGGTLYTHCRHRMKHKKRHVGHWVHIANRTSIAERPKEADGKRFGDFEMDTIVGKNNQDAILTIVERKTNMLFMVKLDHGKDSMELAMAVIKLMKLYKRYIRTFTTDNGPEFAEHLLIKKALKATVYFADPYSPWQKGAIENANGLIRQYIHKGMSFKNLTESDVNDICHKINTRPREKLKFSTPEKCFLNFIS